MNKIGIRAHDIGKFDAHTLANKVIENGFDGVQLVFKKALNSEIDFNHLDHINDAFKNLDIMMLGAYFNPVHPNEKIIKEGVLYFKKHLKIAHSLNAKYVGSETGSYMGSPWGYMPINHSDEALERVINIFKDLTEEAEKQDAYIAIEGAYAHVAYEPERIKTIVDRIHSSHLKVTIDLYNYLNIDNYKDRMQIFDRCFKLLKDKIVIFHLKDFIVENNKLKQVGLGQGLMDFKAIIKRIKTETPDAYIIFEGVQGKDISSSFHLINRYNKEGK
jgi:sugar phosphate isomerase/epimerase